MGMPPSQIFTTPEIILQKLHESIEKGDYNRYIPTEGEQELLHEIAYFENSRLPSERQIYTADHVMIVPGGIQAFSLLTEALLKPSDEVLVPNPSYFSLAALTEMRYQDRTVPAQELNFTAYAYNNAFTLKTKLAWFCQPNNPTGLYIKSKELSEIIQKAASFNSYIVLDESCDNFVYDSQYRHPSNIVDGHVIRIRTFSKDPNLAGYRLGYIVAPPSIISKLKKLAPLLYGNPNVMALRAVLTELQIKNGHFSNEDYTETIAYNYSLMKRMRDFLYTNLLASRFVDTVILPDACYYMLARLDYPKGSSDFSNALLKYELLDVVPGTLFGLPEQETWIRMCFARDQKFLEKALAKLEKVLLKGKAL